MTAKEYLIKTYGVTEDNIKRGIFFRATPSIETLSKLMSDFAQIKCKEIEKYYDTELEMLYEDDIISEKIFLQIKGNSPEPKF
jgi:hypothetical protein